MERSCTDMFCLIVFIVFLGTMLASLGYGIKRGDISKFTAPIDKANRFCGHRGNGYDFTNYKYLFLEDLSSSSSSIFREGYCVDKCPQSSNDTIECASSDYWNCNSDKSYNGGSSSPLYATFSVGHICMPHVTQLQQDRPTAYNNW